MKNKDAFSAFHPIVNFLYFLLVIGFSMFFMHPVCLGLSLLGSTAYAIYLNGRKTVRFALLYMAPLMLFTAFINPAFNHRGITILAYLPSGNPLTLESILYGLSAACMLISVLMWFRCYTEVMTSDKFLYLFGRMVPALSLMLSMALRFVPRFMEQLRQVSEAQRAMGRGISEKNLLKRLKAAGRIFSIVITWSLENAIETADSMKSRGYGLKGRTAFSIYRFEERDKAVVCWLLFCGVYILSGAFCGALDFQYYPMISGAGPNLLSVSFMAVYGLLLATPVIIDRREDSLWKRLRSGI